VVARPKIVELDRVQRKMREPEGLMA
jgi:hypothetical protein